MIEIAVIDARTAAQKFVEYAKGSDKIWVATAWATDGGDFELSEVLLEAFKRHPDDVVVIGKDFNGTDPAFLWKLWPLIRVHDSSDGTFHPKVYVFRSGDSFQAIVGSSNFTPSGFGDNIEVNLLLTGPCSDELFGILTKKVESLHYDGRRMGIGEFEDYEVAYNKMRQRKANSNGHKGGTVPSTRKTSTLLGDGEKLLRSNWDTFASEVKKDGAWKERLEVLVQAKGILERGRFDLDRISTDDINKIIGKAYPYDKTYPNFRYHGTAGSGCFVQCSQLKPSPLRSAVKVFPRSSKVNHKDFLKFVSVTKKLDGIRIGSASRLLAMLRPDTFMSVNRGNRNALARSFGIIPGGLLGEEWYEAYWEMHEMFWTSPWYRSTRPESSVATLWDSRVAMLDAIFNQE